MEFLKNIFGAEALTYDQLAEKLSGNKDIKLGNLASGGYVAKDKYATLEAKVGGLEGQLTEANKKLEGFDPEWKTKAETAAKEADKKVTAVKLDYAIDAALSKAGARNAAIARGQ